MSVCMYVCMYVCEQLGVGVCRLFVGLCRSNSQQKKNQKKMNTCILLCCAPLLDFPFSDPKKIHHVRCWSLSYFGNLLCRRLLVLLFWFVIFPSTPRQASKRSASSSCSFSPERTDVFSATPCRSSRPKSPSASCSPLIPGKRVLRFVFFAFCLVHRTACLVCVRACPRVPV